MSLLYSDFVPSSLLRTTKNKAEPDVRFRLCDAFQMVLTEDALSPAGFLQQKGGFFTALGSGFFQPEDGSKLIASHPFSQEEGFAQGDLCADTAFQGGFFQQKNALLHIGLSVFNVFHVAQIQLS